MEVQTVREWFVGRRQELGVLHGALVEAGGGRPGLVLVNGPAGIGKTVLIERFLSDLEGARLLYISGDETESDVPYAVIDQLLRQAGVSDAGLMGEFQAGTKIVDPVTAGTLVLEALAAPSHDEPAVLVLDDAQWVDAQSLRALLFALRRLVAEPVLTLIAVRIEDLIDLPDGLVRLAARDPGTTITLKAFNAAELTELAAVLGVAHFPPRAAQRLREHTIGNPLYARALLSELPAEVWRGRLSSLPAPQTFEAIVLTRIGACSTAARSLVQGAAVLGLGCRLERAARVSGVREPLQALDEAVATGLLTVAGDAREQGVRFAHPLIQAVAYEGLSPSRRSQLHAAAAGQVKDEWARLRHRAAAVVTVDGCLAAELEEFAEREISRGAWAQAAAGFVGASRVSPGDEQARRRLLRAVDSTLYHGDIAQASGYVEEIAAFNDSPLRDCVLGFLAMMTRRPADAERLLDSAWRQCDPSAEPVLAATVARRQALHHLYRLRGQPTVEWSRRALALAGPPAHAEMLPLGVGEVYAGRLARGRSAVESAVSNAKRSLSHGGVSLLRARGWLRLIGDDLDGARGDLMQEVQEALRVGSLGTAAFALAMLARAEHLEGSWDDAIMHAERAIVITVELEHPFLSLAVMAAVAITAARGEWDAADEQLGLLPAVESHDYEQSLVAASIARCNLAAARGDQQGVLQALSPVQDLRPREGVDEPGCWPWQHLYAEALLAMDRLDEARAFLDQHERLAGKRHRVSAMARLACVHGRLNGLEGDADAAEERFAAALRLVDSVGIPFEVATVEFAWGQSLRRRGHRRVAAERLRRAAQAFDRLGAGPYRERCEVEIRACGLTPAKRRDFDRDRLTPQERSVARLVASGLSNRQTASELVLSVRTIEFHLTNIYAKLGLSSRAQLAALAQQQDP